MNLRKFLQFNDTCPVCQEPLTLYAQCLDLTVWKAKKINDNLFEFSPVKLTTNPFTNNDRLYLEVSNNDTKLTFKGYHKTDSNKKWQMNIFYMCNRSGFIWNENNRFHINSYFACYYRCSPWMDANLEADYNNKKLINLKAADPKQEEMINSSECFAFKDVKDNFERVYILNLDYEEDKTKLWFYKADPKQREDENYDPPLFEKELPMINVRPQFEQRDKLISRLESWVLMS